MSNAREISNLASDRSNITNDKIFACKAWVYFDGANFPVNTGDSEFLGGGNVSSVTSSTTSQIRVNFENNLPHSDYAVVATGAKNAYHNVVCRDETNQYKENSGFTVSVLKVDVGSYVYDILNIIVVG